MQSHCCLASLLKLQLYLEGLQQAAASVAMAIYEAVYDYTSNASGMLSFRSGDKFIFKNRTNDDWWTVENEKGGTGLVPVSYLEQIQVYTWRYSRTLYQDTSHNSRTPHSSGQGL